MYKFHLLLKDKLNIEANLHPNKINQMNAINAINPMNNIIANPDDLRKDKAQINEQLEKFKNDNKKLQQDIDDTKSKNESTRKKIKYKELNEENIHSSIEESGFRCQSYQPSINSEMMIEANPDIIFLAYPNPDIEAVSKRPGWSSIKAVKNGHIFPLNQDILVRPSPRNLEAIKEINKIIYKVVKDENN